MRLNNSRYAVADGNRKPWWIVAIRSDPATYHDNPINEWTLCLTREEIDAAGVALLNKHGTHQVHLCIAEGYWNIEG